jgi:uncharacterized membrane protein
MKRNKKAMSLEMVPTVVVLLVVIGIVLGLGSTILEQFHKQDCTTVPLTGTRYWNESSGVCQNGSIGGWTVMNNGSSAIMLDGLSGIDTFSGFQPTIAIVVVAGVILGIIFAVLVRKYD